MQITITPAQKDIPDTLLTAKAKEVWRARGTDIIDSIEDSSGLMFVRGLKVKIGYLETHDYTWEGNAGKPMQKAITLLFPKSPELFEEMFLWLIIHELGHRILDQNNVRYDQRSVKDEATWTELEHRLLFLFLSESIYGSLGKKLGDRVLDNFPEKGYFDDSLPHTKAWLWAKRLTDSQRKYLKKEVINMKHIELIQTATD